MTAINFRQLIDLAIGSPEPGHVNFYALHCLLCTFAEKLNILEQSVDCVKYSNVLSLFSNDNGAENLKNSSRHKMTETEDAPLSHRKSNIMLETSLGTKTGGKQIPKMSKAIQFGEPSTSKCTTKDRLTGGHDPIEESENPNEPEQGTTAHEETTETEAPPPEVTEVETQPNDEATAEVVQQQEEVKEEEGEGKEEPTATKPDELETHTEEHPVAELTSSPSTAVGKTEMVVEHLPAVQSREEHHMALARASYELTSSLNDMETRLSLIEARIKTQPIDITITNGLSIMKDQLELTMAQLLKLTASVINKKLTTQKIEQLRELSQKLRSIQGENTFIHSTHNFNLEGYQSESSLELDADDEGGENDLEKELIEHPSIVSRLRIATDVDVHHQQQQKEQEQYELDLHVSYPPEKVLDQLLELKSEFCMLTNKVNDIAAAIVEQDCERTVQTLKEHQMQINEIKISAMALKEGHERVASKQLDNIDKIFELIKTLDIVMTEKIDKNEIDILLADKVDYSQLQRKISHEQMDDMQCKMEKQFCELQKALNANEKNMTKIIENLRTSFNADTVEEILKKFKDKVDQEIHALQDTLQKYILSTNDECAAAGARFKVLQDLACLSCDTTCVMRTVEKAKVPKLRNAHATSILSPLITYELGAIRKSGIMGYYRKDDFPHAPNAWTKRQNVSLKACVPRHAGGVHTTYTAKEHVEKVLLSKK